MTVIAYSNAFDALSDIRNHPDYFCAVVANVTLPQMGGFRLARELKAASSIVKIIMMASMEVKMFEFSKVLPSTKVDDFITRDASIEQYRQVIMKHIGDTKTLTSS